MKIWTPADVSRLDSDAKSAWKKLNPDATESSLHAASCRLMAAMLSRLEQDRENALILLKAKIELCDELADKAKILDKQHGETCPRGISASEGDHTQDRSEEEEYTEKELPSIALQQGFTTPEAWVAFRDSQR